MLFLGIEILSIAMYLMSGSRKSDISSNEAAFKYFLMGAFATGFLLFGFALVYGATGSFNLISIAEFLKEGSSSSMLSVGVLLILVAMAFKVSVVPFHFWAPDVYQGAPTPITAFMSTIVKGAAFAGFLRLFFSCFSSVSTLWENTLWVMCAITILIGNITAVYQKNIKRMLAYSSVAHAGYMLMSILALNQFSQGSLFYYAPLMDYLPLQLLLFLLR
jgi:NADH-quinone oxidoreductase subunit N